MTTHPLIDPVSVNEHPAFTQNRILEWPEAKHQMGQYLRTISEQVSRHFETGNGVDDAATNMVVSQIAVAPLIAMDTTNPEAIALWATTRFCHDLCSILAESVDPEHYEDEETATAAASAIAIVLSVAARTGAALADAAELYEQADSEATVIIT